MNLIDIKLTIRNLLVTVQFTIAIFLIICLILIQKQSNFILQQDLGFEKESIISIPNEKGYTIEEANRLKEELRKIPEIQIASLSSQIPGTGITRKIIRHCYPRSGRYGISICQKHYLTPFSWMK